MKYYTHQKPPVIKGEVSNNPSETRQSDDMDIKETIARFFRQGGVIPQQLGANDISAEEKEQMFDAPAESDLIDADLTEQRQYVKEVSEQLKSASAKADTVVHEETPKEEVKEPTDSPKGE